MTANAQIVGNVGKDPEIRFTKGGKAWAKFSVAVTERVLQNGEWLDGDTTWYDIICWNRLAEDTVEIVKKGNRVSVFGRLKMERWTPEGGETRTTPVITAEAVGVVPIVRRRDNSRSNDLVDADAPF